MHGPFRGHFGTAVVISSAAGRPSPQRMTCGREHGCTGFRCIKRLHNGKDNIHTLLIEDHDEYRNNLTALLNTSGRFQCTACGDAEKA